jgi:hypothetical protein
LAYRTPFCGHVTVGRDRGVGYAADGVHGLSDFVGDVDRHGLAQGFADDDSAGGADGGPYGAAGP